MAMNIVIPMAGRGNRFLERGTTIPKPLIPVRGRPMYSWAMDSLPLDKAGRVIFVCLEEHLRERELSADIEARYGRWNPMVIPLSQVTEGQACTVLCASAWINNDDPLLIYNADTFLISDIGARLALLDDDVDGLLSVFRARGDHWSFARVDSTGRVVETAEKRRISEWATTGLYYFARGREFVHHAESMIRADERERGEFYVAPVYNRMIRSGARIEVDVASQVWVLGTPQELAYFEANYSRARE